MGKIILISGPNSSGKGAFAEQLVQRLQGRRFYIATMVPQTEENFLRIEKHRRQRTGLDFTTLELPYRVSEAPVEEGSVVLLEDVSNLLANAVFSRGENAEEVYRDLLGLSKRCGTLIMVTISGMESANYQGETAAYVEALNRLNERLFQTSSTAVVLQKGVPVYRKGNPV